MSAKQRIAEKGRGRGWGRAELCGQEDQVSKVDDDDDDDDDGDAASSWEDDLCPPWNFVRLKCEQRIAFGDEDEWGEFRYTYSMRGHVDWSWQK